MAALTRWVQYLTTSVGRAGDGDGSNCLGTRGNSSATASVGDSFTIGSSNNKLYLSIDGVSAPSITLYSGSELDPRFLARDITEKIHSLGKNDDAFDQAQCIWENNKFKIYSGKLGSSSSVSVGTGTDTAHTTLGWGSKVETGGSAASNGYNGGITISGTYSGLFDETYKIIISKETGIGVPSKGGSNSYLGTMTTGGQFSTDSGDDTYTITIDVTNGTTMGAGTGNVPTMSWTSTGSDNGGPIELLYPNYWYYVGTRGLMVKFTDAVFNTCNPAWTVVCTEADYVQGSNATGPAGTAQYIWSSTRGDDSISALTTSAVSSTRLGSRGITIKFNGSNNFSAGDEFYVIATPPQPYSYDITNLNYGNVTVSTESPVKCVLFEITSGAIEMSTVKFGLQSHGSFSHHDQGNNDTKFRFGTVGPGNKAGTSPTNGLEWRTSVVASDISSNTPPAYLYATKEDLAVVSDADTSESIGVSHFMGMVADPIWLNIKLGSSEVGANSSINQRVYFDYS
jgi:hypothetical protein